MDGPSVLFVCLGNICRSPAAEAVLRHCAAEAGVEDLRVDSAGTSGYHDGEPADARMRAAGERRGYRLDSLSRQVTADDLDRYDLVVAMDSDNRRALQRLANGRDGRIRMFSDFLDDGHPENVPDPYFGGEDGFDRVLDLLEAGCPRILEAVVAEHRREHR